MTFIGDAIVLIILGIIVAFAARSIIKARKKGT